MALELAQIIAELIESIGGRGKLKAGEHGLVDLLGGCAADGMAAVKQDLQQANDTRVVDFDAGVAHRGLADGQGKSLQQGKSTWTFKLCAWKLAKRSVLVRNLSRTASR